MTSINQGDSRTNKSGVVRIPQNSARGRRTKCEIINSNLQQVDVIKDIPFLPYRKFSSMKR